MSHSTRPKLTGPALHAATAKAMLPDVCGWSGGVVKEQEQERILADLLRALSRVPDMDGYRLARELDIWEPDAALVALLDGATHYAYQAQRDAVAAWVRERGITPRHQVDDTVTVTYADQECRACIKGVLQAQAQYVLAHVSERPRFAGLLVPFEAVEELCERPIQTEMALEGA